MKGFILLTCLVCTIAAVPIPDSDSDSKDLDIIQIPINGNKELDILSLVDKDGKISDRNKRTIGMLRQLFPTLTKLNANPGNALETVISGDSVRVARETVDAAESAAAASENAENKVDAPVSLVAAADQSSASSDLKAEAKAPAIDELSLEGDENDENRDKRFLSFGGSDASSGGGGSGNFLFDIVRRTADRAARAAGTVYRVVAGTETLALNNYGTDTGSDSDHAKNTDETARSIRAGYSHGLVGGSSGTQQTDESENSPDGSLDGETDGRTSDGYTEGIPGPITRLFVLANRGLANLIQDLILRLAQTSERVVNFKARLITSLI